MKKKECWKYWELMQNHCEGMQNLLHEQAKGFYKINSHIDLCLFGFISFKNLHGNAIGKRIK